MAKTAARPWLADGVGLVARASLLYDHADAIGVEVRHKRGGRSWTAPWGTVYIGITDDTPVTVEAAVLAHELRHARQMGRGWRAWWWVARYLALPSHRRRVEVEAEAEECAVWGALAYRAATPDALMAVAEGSAASLGGWRWPHLTGGGRAKLLAEVATLAAGYLAEAQREASSPLDLRVAAIEDAP